MGKAWWLAVAFVFAVALDSTGATAQDADATTIPDIAAPPRTIGGLGKLPTSLAEVATPPACVVPSEKLTAQRVDAIAETMVTGSGFTLDSLLRFKAQEELRAGQLSNALVLQRKAIAVSPWDWRKNEGRNHLYLAFLLARAGEFRKAAKAHVNGLRVIASGKYSEPSCRVNDSFFRHRGAAAIAFASGDMKAAAIRYGKAYQKLEELRTIGGDCAPRARTHLAEMRLGQAEALLWDGRLMEAESVAREAIRLSRKSRPRALVLLSDIFLEQGRMTQAFRVALGAIRMQDKLCVPSDAFEPGIGLRGGDPFAHWTTPLARGKRGISETRIVDAFGPQCLGEPVPTQSRTRLGAFKIRQSARGDGRLPRPCGGERGSAERKSLRRARSPGAGRGRASRARPAPRSAPRVVEGLPEDDRSLARGWRGDVPVDVEKLR